MDRVKLFGSGAHYRREFEVRNRAQSERSASSRFFAIHVRTQELGNTLGRRISQPQGSAQGPRQVVDGLSNLKSPSLPEALVDDSRTPVGHLRPECDSVCDRFERMQVMGKVRGVEHVHTFVLPRNGLIGTARSTLSCMGWALRLVVSELEIKIMQSLKPAFSIRSK